MIAVNLGITAAGKETGALLRSYLEARGLTIDARASIGVCFGRGVPQAQALNAACELDKMARLRRMSAAGVSTVPWFEGPSAPADFKFPAFARKANGYGATDLMPVFQAEEVLWRVAAGWDWFSSIVPILAELRVWVFKGEVLAVYQKVMRRPSEYVKMGRNFGQGFEFAALPNTATGSVAAIAAAEAVGLDFAAVDLIIGEDGRDYILECNTAPGVIRSGQQSTLAKLADRIVTWVQEQDRLLTAAA